MQHKMIQENIGFLQILAFLQEFDFYLIELNFSVGVKFRKQGEVCKKCKVFWKHFFKKLSFLLQKF